MVYKMLALKKDVHQRLVNYGAGDGLTFNYVVACALDAYDEKTGFNSKVKNDG